MSTAGELDKIVQERRAQLDEQEENFNNKRKHVKPCDDNFTYSDISKGSKEGLDLILSEIKPE